MTLEMELRHQRRLGREDAQRRVILKLAEMNMSIAFIEEATEASPEFIEKVLSEKSAAASPR